MLGAERIFTRDVTRADDAEPEFDDEESEEEEPFEPEDPEFDEVVR